MYIPSKSVSGASSLEGDIRMAVPPPPLPPPSPPASEALPGDSYRVKRCDVRLRAEDAVGQSILEAQLDLSHTCDLPTCTKVGF